jgi:hypothetical protein
MAQSYASRLKKGIDYGTCGLPELYETARVLEDKVKRLAQLIKNAKYVVAFTGAGTSFIIALTCRDFDFFGDSRL